MNPQNILADALELHDYDDWYNALLYAAIAETNDAGQAVKIADEAFKSNPKDCSKSANDDADALFAVSEEKYRNEYGPRHQPPKRIEGAVARLEALMEHADSISEESLAAEIDGIAREFNAAEFKEIAKEFGIKRGLATKLMAVQKVLEKVCKEKE